MDELIGLSASAAGGGLFGLIGTLSGRIASYLERRQAAAHERARWDHEARLIDLHRAARAEESEAALALAETEGRWAGLTASVAAEAAIPASFRWVDAVRGLTRPALTFLLWAIAGLVFLAADAAGRAAIIDTATFAATAATLWWFGDRGPRANARPRRD